MLIPLAVGIAITGACNCGPQQTLPPSAIVLGQTTLLVHVNPRVNDANQASVPQPGSARAQVMVSVANGPAVLTDARGVAVLAGLDAGVNTVAFSGANTAGQVTVTLEEKELRELAVAVTGTGAQTMADFRYRFGGQVVEVNPGMSEAQVNAALTGSNKIVLFSGGSYTGNLTFTGSDVTLFAAGADGGTVTLAGNIQVMGSANRIRGTRISGPLTVNGSNFGLSGSQITGTFSGTGSTGIYLNNDFCQGATLSGSTNTVLENSGLAPIPARDGGC
ncbi:MAG TPA: hypothetical protein VK447_04880 [Myxococcaceae bacterium]|nr:hypothetical protein [Myxococcaceae bacterium]